MELVEPADLTWPETTGGTDGTGGTLLSSMGQSEPVDHALFTGTHTPGETGGSCRICA